MGVPPHLGKFQVKRKVVAPESKSAVGKEPIPALPGKICWFGENDVEIS
jgi:hypothetical protein